MELDKGLMKIQEEEEIYNKFEEERKEMQK